MKAIRPIITLLFLAAASQATAQAYKCLDANGKIEYRGSPCGTSQTVEKTFNQALAPSDAEHANRPPKVTPQASNEPERTPVAQVTPQGESKTVADNAHTPSPAPTGATISGGICTDSFSWDACRKLGIDSLADCKRMDDDLVFRTGVLQSKGIQCKYSDNDRKRRQ